MTTNDLRPLEQPGAGPVYTVLLTAKGKYLHDMFAYSIPGEAGTQADSRVLTSGCRGGVVGAGRQAGRRVCMCVSAPVTHPEGSLCAVSGVALQPTLCA
jgi:hypothetical protein